MAQNSFAGTNLRVGNQGVRSVIDEAMSFRTQVTRTDEVRQVGGWGDPLNQILSEGLGRIRKTLALVTYNSDSHRTQASQARIRAPGNVNVRRQGKGRPLTKTSNFGNCLASQGHEC